MQTIFFSLSIPSGFTKDAKWRISSVGVDTVIFAPDLIEYAFEYEFSFQMQNLRESIQMTCATRFTNLLMFALIICAIFFQAPQKACLFWNGCDLDARGGIFPRIIYLECKRNTKILLLPSHVIFNLPQEIMLPPRVIGNVLFLTYEVMVTSLSY